MSSQDFTYQTDSLREPLGVFSQIAQQADFVDSSELWPHTIESPTSIRNEWLWKLVSITERTAAAIILIGASPIFIPAFLAVAILSRRTPLVAHRRVGQNGRELWVLKLRTMWGANTTTGTLQWGVEKLADERISSRKEFKDIRIKSRIASFCRKYSIDEIPQLWQVVRGEMALVGPRPLTADEIRRHYGDASASIFRLKPGLTGLWQIKGRSRLDYRHRRTFDRFMVQHWSFGLYLLIVWLTIPRVLLGKDAW